MTKSFLAAVSVTIILTLTSNLVNAQSFMHAFGATPSVLFGKDGYNNKFYVFQTALTYFPRFNFVENDNSSLSIGTPVGVGIGIANNGDDPGIGFSFDVPAVVDYNIGCKSTPDNETYFGGYFGAGFGYSRTQISGSSYSNLTAASYGPLVRTGVRIGSAKERYQNQALTIGFYFKKGLEAAKYNTAGINVLVDF